MRTESQHQTISAVVPAYGVEPYLADCIDSLLRVPSLLEIIVVIDASPDQSAYIAQQYASSDRRVIVIENAQNMGLGASRNIGLAAARGDYVIFVDSDDLVVSEGLEAMVGSLQVTNSDFATACADEFGRSSARLRYWTTRAPIFRHGATRTNIRRDPDLIQDHTAWTKLFRRSFLLRHNLSWAENTKCEDVATSTRAYVLAEAVDVVPGVSYLYRRRPGSITTALSADRTIGDWGRQNLAAMHHADAITDPAPMQVLIRKILDVEARSRLQALGAIANKADRQAAEFCIREAMCRANLDTLEASHPDVVREGLNLLSQHALPDHLHLAATRFGLEANAPIEEGGDTTRPQPSPQPSVDDIASRSHPELSVVMPTYNVAPYVAEAVKSILDQTYRSFELIIVDDYSDDGTWEIITKYASKDPRVRIFRNAGVGGAQARNYGVQQAVGKFLAFADGDDLVPTHAYKRMADALRIHNSDMVVGDFQKFWPTSVWRNTHAWGLEDHVDATTLLGHPRLITNRTCWNRMFRSRFWRNERLHFPSSPRANDILPMTTAMVKARRITAIPDVVYHYRARPGSSSMTAKLSSAPSVISYFRQEALCAGIIGAHVASSLSEHYWRASIAGDAWGNIGLFLQRAGEQGLEGGTAIELAEAVASLWTQVPESLRLVLSARKQLTYELVIVKEYAAAKTLWMSESSRAWQKTREASVEVLEALIAVPNTALVKDAILRVFHDDVIRPIIDDSTEWSPETAEKIVVLSRSLNKRVGLIEAAVPETKEPRLVQALLCGGENSVWREARSIGDAEGVTLNISTDANGGVVLTPAPVGSGPNRTPMRLEWHEAPGEGRGRRYPIPFPDGEYPSTGISLRAEQLDPLRGRRWNIKAVVLDELGERLAPTFLDVNSMPRRSSFRIDGTSLYLLHRGRDRAIRAVSWRIKRLTAPNGRRR